MKNHAGIDLADLTEAQRKMCVKLLAMNNVEIIQDHNSYVATLKVPSKDVNNYLLKQNSEIISTNQKENKILKGNNKENKQSMKQLSNSKTKSQKNLTDGKKQYVKINYGKKSLFKSVKLPPIPKLEALCPEIQIYIYPKRLPFPLLQEQIQQIYQQYWQMSKANISGTFLNTFYQVICPLVGPGNKSKNDQSLVNMLQSINHFQHKEVGVKIFFMFLSQSYEQEKLSYFLVLRALLEQFMGQKIINIKIKQKILGQNSGGNPSTINATIKQKLKWIPTQKQIPQHICLHFLKVAITNTANVDNIFEKLTQKMYYCELKKNNYIKYYDLLDFMLKQFDKECYDASVENLELSYSNNGSTINDIFLETEKREYQEPIQTKIQVPMMPKYVEQYLPPQPQPIDNQSILFQYAVEKVKEMCRRVQMSPQNLNIIVEKVKLCVQSVVTMDKIKWVQAMEIQGTEEQLYFIEETQLQYRNICKDGIKLAIPNNLVKRIFSGPGFIRLFSSLIIF